MADLREVAYAAVVTVERGGVTITVDGVSGEDLASVISSARRALTSAGVKGDPPQGLEHVGGYAPLDVPEEDGEGYIKRRVGFA